MPFTHARRRGATVLFRRKIPVDLRDRFGSHEIVRSIGARHARRGASHRASALVADGVGVYMLDHNDVTFQRDSVAALAREVVGRDVETGSADERRLCRAVTEGLQVAAGPAAAVFDRLAQFRPATSAVRLIDEAEFEAPPR